MGTSATACVGLGMGATCVATIWKRSHLGELRGALTFPLHLEDSLLSRGGYVRHENSFTPPSPQSFVQITCLSLCMGGLERAVAG